MSDTILANAKNLLTLKFMIPMLMERLAEIQAIVDQIKIDIPKPESKVGEE